MGNNGLKEADELDRIVFVWLRQVDFLQDDNLFAAGHGLQDSPGCRTGFLTDLSQFLDYGCSCSLTIAMDRYNFTLLWFFKLSDSCIDKDGLSTSLLTHHNYVLSSLHPRLNDLQIPLELFSVKHSTVVYGYRVLISLVRRLGISLNLEAQWVVWCILSVNQPVQCHPTLMIIVAGKSLKHLRLKFCISCDRWELTQNAPD